MYFIMKVWLSSHE